MSTVTNSTKTLSSMREKVYFLISESSGSLFPSTIVNDFINEAFGRMHQLLDNSYDNIYTTTSSGLAAYTIPEPMMYAGNALVDKVWINDQEISATSYTEWVDSSGATVDLDSTDEPTSYFVNGNYITLYPTPDAAYQLKIKYRRESPKLVNDADTVSLSDVYVDAAVYFACYMLKAKDEQWQSANFFKAEYDRLVQDMAMIKPGIYQDGTGVYGGAD